MIQIHTKEKLEILEGLQEKVSQAKKTRKSKEKSISDERKFEIHQEAVEFIRVFRTKEEYDLKAELESAAEKYGDEFGVFTDEIIKSYRGATELPFRNINYADKYRRVSLSNFLREIYYLKATNKKDFLGKYAKFFSAEQLYQFACENPKKIYDYVEVLIKGITQANHADYAWVAVMMAENIKGAPLDILTEIVANFGGLGERERMAKLLGKTLQQFEDKYIYHIDEMLEKQPRFEEVELRDFIGDIFD